MQTIKHYTKTFVIIGYNGQPGLRLPLSSLFRIKRVSYMVNPGLRLSTTNQLNARIDRAKLRYMRSELKGLY
jgi:hypothetical protein